MYDDRTLSNRSADRCILWILNGDNGTMAIAMLADTPIVETEFHVSFDLQKEWQKSCEKAMGFEDDEPEHDDDKASSAIHILNLMDHGEGDIAMIDARDNTTQTSENHWMDNANQIASSITQMADMIAKNQKGYVTGDLTEEEASVLESTVLSFSATAANQIDSLRSAIPPQSADYVHHCSGVVAGLLLRLRETVANPMASFQKQRTRTAMSIYQHPLACRLVMREDDREMDGTMWDQLVEDDTEGQYGNTGTDEQRFLPRHSAPAMSADFMATYASNDVEIMSRPPSLFQKKQETLHRESLPPPAKQLKFSAKTMRIKEERMLYHQQHDEVRLQEETQQELQKEAVLLEASLQNDLDSVYQVEQRMTEITALLSQFSSLVSEQQEEIVTIHDTTLSSKENVSKGQESLIDAKERTKRSKHYMATLVWSVAMILLFFNYITP